MEKRRKKKEEREKVGRRREKRETAKERKKKEGVPKLHQFRIILNVIQLFSIQGGDPANQNNK